MSGVVQEKTLPNDSSAQQSNKRQHPDEPENSQTIEAVRKRPKNNNNNNNIQVSTEGTSVSSTASAQNSKTSDEISASDGEIVRQNTTQSASITTKNDALSSAKQRPDIFGDEEGSSSEEEIGNRNRNPTASTASIDKEPEEEKTVNKDSAPPKKKQLDIFGDEEDSSSDEESTTAIQASSKVVRKERKSQDRNVIDDNSWIEDDLDGVYLHDDAEQSDNAGTSNRKKGYAALIDEGLDSSEDGTDEDEKDDEGGYVSQEFLSEQARQDAERKRRGGYIDRNLDSSGAAAIARRFELRDQVCNCTFVIVSTCISMAQLDCLQIYLYLTQCSAVLLHFFCRLTCRFFFFGCLITILFLFNFHSHPLLKG